MTQTFEGDAPGKPARTGRAKGGPVFWMLALMGLATFAPCVLLPEWRDYQAAQVAVQREQHKLDQLKRAVERTRRQLDAMQNDPAVAARLAERDLGFRRANERTVSVEIDDSPPVIEEPPFIPQPVEPPAWVARATGWLPDLDYDAIFCDDRTRPVVMTMSIALIVAAAALFHGRSPATEEPR